MLQAIVVFVFHAPHNCQVGALLSALFHCHTELLLYPTPDQALQALSASEAAHRKVCWLTCCARQDRCSITDLRSALVSEVAHVFLLRPILMGPTVHVCVKPSWSHGASPKPQQITIRRGLWVGSYDAVHQSPRLGLATTLTQACLPQSLPSACAVSASLRQSTERAALSDQLYGIALANQLTVSRPLSSIPSLQHAHSSQCSFW